MGQLCVRPRLQAAGVWALLWFSAVFVVSCSSDRAAVTGEQPDASTPSIARPANGPVLELAEALAAHDPIGSARLAATDDGLRNDADGVTSPGWRSASLHPSRAIAARLPAHADEAIEAGVGRGGAYRMRLQPLRAQAAPIALDGGRAVYERAYPSTDVVFVAQPERLEWMYLLRDEHAPREIAMKLELPEKLPSTKLELDGSIGLVDESGNVQLRITRPVARDSRGVERKLGLAVEDGELRVSLDTRGLAYPVLVDPAIETPVWEKRQGPPEPRRYPALAFDAARGRTVLFGGAGDGLYGDTWEWDGTGWLLLSLTGPPARSGARAVYDTSRQRVVMFGGQTGSGAAADLWEWDGARWTELCTSAACIAGRPPADAGPHLAYHPGRGVVLFASYGDTWEWNGTSWAQRCTTTPCVTTKPVARSDAAIFYDTVGGSTLLFGGQSGTTDLGDTWRWSGTAWTQLAPATNPGPRHATSYTWRSTDGFMFSGVSNYAVVYDAWRWNGSNWIAASPTGSAPGVYTALTFDSVRGKTVSFGDGTSETVELSGGAWQAQTSYPSPRSGHSLAFDSGRSRVVLFGGVSNWDTWEWTGLTWARVCTTAPCNATVPAARNGQTMAYDSIRGKTVMFGGNFGAGLGDTWEWDGAAWAQQCTTAPCNATLPAGRWNANMAFDQLHGQIVMFGGGSGGGLLGDTWAFDGAAWTQLCAACATKPSARQSAPLAYDKARHVVVLFGGADAGGNLQDTWEWNGAAWALRATGGPPARAQGALAYDDARGRVVLFGGQGTGSQFGDTWEWNGTTWTQETATPAPPQRVTWAAFDSARRRMVVFGGYSATWAYNAWADTWEYHNQGGSCGSAASCDTGYCTDGVCCEDYICGTCQACNTSGHPGQCAAVTSADDTDTCTGASTCDSFGACKKKNGQGCASGADCASTYCADGYCCNAPCAGGCDVCSATPGTCTVLAGGSVGVACGGFRCNGTAGDCPTSCAADGDCQGGYFCGYDGTCQNRHAQGKPCDTAAGADCKVTGCRECNAGLTCVDHYCCDQACSGTCQSCGVTPGTCSTITSADDDTCTGANTCSATGTCQKKNGQSCTAGTECASGNCADGYCCNLACNGGCNVCALALGAAANGDCTQIAQGSPGANPSCSPYLCNGSTSQCPTSCGSDADCAATYYCAANGTCAARKAQGLTCDATSGADCKSAGCRVCTSGNCIDGFCCDSACGGSCDACNGASLGWAGATNGTCKIAPVTYPGNPGCTPYACNGTVATCATTCTTDAQCGAGYYCGTAGTCQAQKLQGQACNLTTDCKTSGCRECTTGSCVDGYCCNSACSGACDTCGATPGTCTLLAAGSAGSPACSPYLCNGSAASCGGSCTSDAQCVASYFCRTSDGTCQPDQAAGGACTSGAQCQAGLSCADGVCCDTTCTGACQACTAAKKGAGADGTCGTIKAGTDPDGECATDPTSTCKQDGFCNGAGACKLYVNGTSCGATTCATGTQTSYACDGLGTCKTGTTTACSPYVCANTTSCATTCTTDAGCIATSFCRTSDSTCQPDQANGAACASGAQCTSGNCIDGVCCDTACGGLCQACTAALKGAGLDGACGNVKLDTDPQNECTDDGATSCQKNGLCNGAGACKLYASGTTCGATTCSSGTQTGYSCDGFGVCKSGNATSCAPYTCGATACLSTCSADAQCVATSWCRVSDGTCQADQANGAACTASTQCTSGNCVDGVCCDAPCAGSCQACSAAKKGSGSDGVCGSVKADTDPDNECATSSSSTCLQNGNCDGAGACKLWAPGTICGATTCGSGTQTGYSCDGFGVCKAGNTTQCTPYQCSGNACGTTCVDDSGCIAAYFCRTSDGTCQPDQAAGAACGSSAQCSSGNCVDGFCCDSPCNGLCQACSVAKKGAGANGTCGNVAVDSDPDNECATDLTSTCKQTGFCNGAGSCKLYTAGTSCASNACATGIQTPYACDGLGTCKAGAASTCAPYVCASTTACGTTCTGDAGCVATSFCRVSDGTCQPDQSNGAACASASQCVSGNCIDGVCCDVACTGLCQACTTALKGSGANGVCGNIAAASDPQNECADDGTTSCQKNGLCNGAGACQLYASGTTCGATTCSGTTQTGYACDGLGACKTGSTTACDPFTCGATACLASCTSDSGCVATSFCRVTDGTCQSDQTNGGACTSSSQCVSGYCVDGFCCDAPCGGSCQACSAAKKGSGTNGVCGSIKVDTDPDNECTSTAASTCQLNGNCDGNGACKLWVPGTVCGATTCGNGTQTGYQCDGFGVCKAGNTTLCAPYTCSGNVCGTSCADDSGCIAADWCRTSDGTCQPDQANAAACTGGTQCASGNCVDGVCCDAPCNGLCQACSAAKKGSGVNGVCGAIKVDADPDNECATDATSTCKQTGFCDGAGACKKYPSGTSCGSTTCASGVQTGYQCDGFGTCQTGATTTCAPYACADAVACATSCAGDSSCVASAFCDSATGSCKGDQTNGGACTAGNQCISGFCVDGVCCDQACNAGCQACTAAKKGGGQSGVCGSIAKGTDPDDECADEGASSCAHNGLCNGAGACDLYAAGVACGASTCTSGTQTGYACNGLGTCASAASSACAPYVCAGAACGSTCSSDADCIASSFCRLTDGTCQPDQGTGAACAAATQCSSGNCADGVCCDAPCAGTCQACSAGKKGSGADGVCGNVAVGTDPDNECNDDGSSSCKQNGSCSGLGTCQLYGLGTACGATTCGAGQQTGYACDGSGTCMAGQSAQCSPYVCNGGSCGVSCASDADCVASAFCDASSHCVADQANGASCATTSQCTSGFCTDGVCCDQACGGTCQACSATKKGNGSADGVCGMILDGTDPDSDCTVDAPSTCKNDGACDGSGKCRQYALGTACGPNSCSGSELTGQQCDGFGTCVPGQKTKCDPFLCYGTSCPSSCADDKDCVAGAFCGNSECKPKADNATACAADHECKSGFCVEGLCCNTACDGVCQACTAANKASGADGVCADAKAGVDPHGSCADDGQTSCGLDGTCNGAGACRLYSAGTACGTTSCVGNVQTGFACNGSGTCDPNATTDCALFACASGQCKTACAGEQDCASTAYCDLGSASCKPKDADGKACTGSGTCQSGFCVDGVCCNEACSGQCQACDVATAKGTCSPVVGAPHGSRTACAAATGTAPDDKCAARACDGSKSVATCVGYVGADVPCRDESCAKGEETFSATCNGQGQCGAGDAKTVKPCEPYACGATSCKDKCAVDGDCAPAYKCDAASGKCISGATCDGDHTITAPGQAPTDCRPYRCETGGTCKGSCASVDDCMAGFVCADGLCSTSTTAGAAEGDAGGCACRVQPAAPSPARGGIVAGAILAALALAARRRRRSATRLRDTPRCP